MTQHHNIPKTYFECEECNHEWSGNPDPTGHDWETCPNCGADDGENCWDCGFNVAEEGNGGVMCTTCRRTLCDDCAHPLHTWAREEDKGRCGATVRVL